MLFKIKNCIRTVTEFDYIHLFSSLKQFLRNSYQDFLKNVAEIRQRSKDLPKSNYDLGVFHYQHGNFTDSIFRFKLCLLFKSRFSAKIYYYLARLYIELHELEKARNYINLYNSSEDKEFASSIKYLENLLLLSEDKEADVTEIPIEYIKIKYDRLAETGALSEKAIRGLEELIKIMLEQQKKEEVVFNNGLHLGCKFGDFGYFLRAEKLVTNLTGVEISPKLVKVTNDLNYENIKVYNNIYATCYSDFFKEHKVQEQNIVIIEGILSYYKDIDEILQLSFKSLDKNGYIYILTAIYDGKEKFNYQNEEFCHTINYIKGIGERYGKFLEEKTFKVFEQNFCIIIFKK